MGNSHGTSDWTIRGKTALITGGGAGIGRFTSIELMKRGLEKLIIADINTDWGDEVAAEIRKACNFTEEEGRRRVVVKYLDLASLASVRQFAAEILATEPKLHLLINNAGINPPARRQVTTDGFELTFATNYFGHFLLTNLLLDLLKISQPSRIVAMTSAAYLSLWPQGLRVNDLQIEKHRFDYFYAYSHSKLAIILFVRKLAIMLKAEKADVSVFMIHPGMVRTDILKHRAKWWQFFVNKIVHPLRFIVVTVKEGSKTPLYCCCKPDIEHYSGKYFHNCRPVYIWPHGKDDVAGEKLWKISEQYCAQGSPMVSSVQKEK